METTRVVNQCTGRHVEEEGASKGRGARAGKGGESPQSFMCPWGLGELDYGHSQENGQPSALSMCFIPGCYCPVFVASPPLSPSVTPPPQISSTFKAICFPAASTLYSASSVYVAEREAENSRPEVKLTRRWGCLPSFHPLCSCLPACPPGG